MPDIHRWYDGFFQGIVLEMWRQAATPEQTEAEADCLVKALGLVEGSRVLDVPCGMGRHAIALARRGMRLTAVDLSAEAIAIARKEAGVQGLPVEWVHADMREIRGSQVFDAACCMGNSFGYLEPEGTRLFIQALARTLRPGGRFAMDYGTVAESILTHFEEQQEAEFGGIRFREENRYLAAESCIETIYTFERGGESETRVGRQYVYTVREVRGLLAEAGLEVIDMASSPAGDPYRLGAPVLLLTARKR